MCFSSVILTWLISSIPLLANSNTSSVGCTAVVMAAEFRGQGVALKYPGYDYFRLLSFHLAKWLPLSSSRFSDLGRSGCSERERDHEPGFRGVLWPRWEQPRPSLTRRLGPAAPGASTPGGEAEREMGGLRLGGILDHFNFTERQERLGGAEVAQRKSACARGDRNPERTVQITDL